MKKVSMFAALALIVAISAPQAANAEDVLTGFLGDAVSQKNNGKGHGHKGNGHGKGHGGKGAFGGAGSSGINFMGEALFLRPYNTDGDEDSDTDTNQYKAAARLTLGYTGPSGLGARVRWFDYDVNTTDSDFQTQTLDGELYGNVDLGCRWLATFSAGMRYAEMSENEGDATLRDSWGPIVGAEIHYLWTDRVSLYGIARSSVLVGDVDGDDDKLAASANELQIGSEYRRCLNNGMIVFARGGVEGQHWDGWSEDDAETFGLFGFTSAVGFQY